MRRPSEPRELLTINNCILRWLAHPLDARSWVPGAPLWRKLTYRISQCYWQTNPVWVNYISIQSKHLRNPRNCCFVLSFKVYIQHAHFNAARTRLLTDKVHHDAAIFSARTGKINARESVKNIPNPIFCRRENIGTNISFVHITPHSSSRRGSVSIVGGNSSIAPSTTWQKYLRVVDHDSGLLTS